MSYLPDSYKVRSGPGVSGVRFQAGSRFFTTDTLYEASQSDVFIWIKSTASFA
jgi:hypothetical protein